MADTTSPASWLLGKPRLLQDRKTVVTVTSVSADRIGWHCAADGSTGTTLASIFLAVTTGAPKVAA